MAPNRAYLDTCIVSEIVKNEIGADEIRALRELLTMHDENQISLSVSDAVEDELNDIPPEHAAPHHKIFEKFRNLPKTNVGGITRMGLSGGLARNPKYRLWKRLTACLPDEPDAMHVFVAATNRCSHLVTVDRKTMLTRAEEVYAASGVHLVLPTEMLAEVKQIAC